jgi:hypothetical protein
MIKHNKEMIKNKTAMIKLIINLKIFKIFSWETISKIGNRH